MVPITGTATSLLTFIPVIVLHVFAFKHDCALQAPDKLPVKLPIPLTELYKTKECVCVDAEVHPELGVKQFGHQ